MIKLKEKIYKGLPASKGISIGRPFIYAAESPVYNKTANGSISASREINGYREAVEQSKKELNKIFNLAKEKLDVSNLMIFDAQLQFLNDEVLHKKIISRIENENLPAYYVFNNEIENMENNLLASNDEYIRERVNDIEDLKNRVLRNLAKGKLISKIDENSIVVAHNLTPADTILFSNRNLLGFATDSGGINSHAAIIARSINIPAVVGMKDISANIKPEDFLIIDGYKGQVIKNPSKDTVEKYKLQIKKNSRFEKKLLEIEKLPTETKDWKSVTLSVNIEFNNEVDYVAAHAGCGVGLYRTEHMFLEAGDYPSEEEQYNQYKMLSDRIMPHWVTIRTFDIGGDKILPGAERESNPALGWRGIRISLDMETEFLTQLRAILRASKNGNLRIMFPMISGLDEVLKIKELAAKAKAQLRKQKIRFDENIKTGIMIEVPSAVFIADSLAKEVDFFSFGTNDLVQYLIAADRDSNMVSNLYRKFHPAVIKAIKQTIDSAKKNHIHISICGEMAGDPKATALLLGLGIDELSVETNSFLSIKKLIRSLKYSDAKKIAEKVLTMDTEEKINKYLEKAFNTMVK